MYRFVCYLWYLCCFSLELVHDLDQARAQLQESNDRIVYMDEEFNTARHSLEADNFQLLDDLEKLNDKYNRFGIIRLHPCSRYVDAAYYYRQSSVVGLSVTLSVS